MAGRAPRMIAVRRVVISLCIGFVLCMAASLRSTPSLNPAIAEANGYRAVPATAWPRPAPVEWKPPCWQFEWSGWHVTWREFGSSNAATFQEMALVRRFGAPRWMVGVSSGFPCRALSQWAAFESASGIPGAPVWSEGRYVAKLPIIGAASFGVLPLWHGLVINTLFYAALAWGLWGMSRHVRRRWRGLRGRCPKCGYDLAGIGGGAGDAKCPECGAVPTGR